MKVSYESEELIEEVLEDIDLFGEDDEVFAIYSYFEVVDGRKIDAEFITDYFSATEPVRESNNVAALFCCHADIAFKQQGCACYIYLKNKYAKKVRKNY